MSFRLKLSGLNREPTKNERGKATLCNPVVPVGHLLNARQFHSEVNP